MAPDRQAARRLDQGQALHVPEVSLQNCLFVALFAEAEGVTWGTSPALCRTHATPQASSLRSGASEMIRSLAASSFTKRHFLSNLPQLRRPRRWNPAM